MFIKFNMYLIKQLCVKKQIKNKVTLNVNINANMNIFKQNKVSCYSQKLHKPLLSLLEKKNTKII